MRTQDKTRSPLGKRLFTNRAERLYVRSLRQVAAQVGRMIAAFPPADPSALPTIEQMLAKYAEALAPWAHATAAKMIAEVNQRDLAQWRTIGQEMSAEIRREILTAPTGEAMRKLMEQQVSLIKSIPTDAAQRVHDLTIKSIEDSGRASEIAKEIMRSGDVAQSRATLIARTEVSRTASNLTQARAEHIGSEGYVWESAHDGTVRPSHAAMRGKFVAWSTPPTLDGMTGHAGCLPNCRCWARVVLPE